MSMKFLSLFSVLILAACGFSPMYGNSSGANATAPEAGMDQVAIAIIPDREGQFLRNALIDRFYSNGMPANPAYELSFSKINEGISDFDITVDSEATRRQLKLSTTMTLTDNATKQIVLKRPLQAITSHNVLDSEFSTLVTEQSAREAALNDLARQAERQIALYFSR
ncbi:MAG TPA: LPS assembly lipoprotein LptE [Alphaproteobacteria bacterium]|nr:LPS assembly lipoprotein LptE [Alphaproteobacteria bacterium]